MASGHNLTGALYSVCITVLPMECCPVLELGMHGQSNTKTAYYFTHWKLCIVVPLMICFMAKLLFTYLPEKCLGILVRAKAMSFCLRQARTSPIEYAWTCSGHANGSPMDYNLVSTAAHKITSGTYAKKVPWNRSNSNEIWHIT